MLVNFLKIKRLFLSFFMGFLIKKTSYQLRNNVRRQKHKNPICVVIIDCIQSFLKLKLAWIIKKRIT